MPMTMSSSPTLRAAFLRHGRAPLLAPLAALALLVACADGAGDDDDNPPTASDPQLPPEGAADVDAWLAEGHYLDWTCEPAPHDSRAPSPHGRNRICNNDKLALATSAPWEVGSASVKELLDAADAIVGYAVYTKAADGGAGPTDGSTWYWYEKADGDVVADGRGASGAPLTICVDCHSHAGGDNNEMDFVFTKLGGSCGG